MKGLTLPITKGGYPPNQKGNQMPAHKKEADASTIKRRSVRVSLELAHLRNALPQLELLYQRTTVYHQVAMLQKEQNSIRYLIRELQKSLKRGAS